MKIFLTWATSAAGGAERSVALLADSLRRLPSVDAVQLFCIDVSDSAKAAPPTRIANYRAALNAVVDHDSIIVSSHRTFLVDLPIAEAARTPLAIFFRTSGAEADHTRIVGNDGRLMKLPWTDFPWNLVGRLQTFAPSHFAATNLTMLSLGRVEPHPVFNPVPVHRSRTPPPSTRCLLIAGRFTPFKQFGVAIAALARLGPPPVPLTIAGDGSERGRLETLGELLGVREQLSFRGWVGDLSSVIEDHQAFVHTCAWDAFGRVALEAAALGRVCLVPEGSAVREILGPSSGALGYRAHSTGQLAQAMEEVMRMTEDERRDRGRASFEAVAAACDPATIATEVLRTLHTTGHLHL